MNLVLRAFAVGTHLDRSTFPSIVPQLSTGVARYLKPCVGMLASTNIIIRVLILERSTVLLLWLKVISDIPLPLSCPLLIEIVTPLLHCHFYID